MKPHAYSFSISLYPATTFGQFIRKARLEKGWRQKDVATMLDVDEQTITNWERSVDLPRQYWQVKMLCEALEVSYEKVVEGFSLDHRPSTQRFGTTLKKSRILRGLKQEEVARLAGIDPTTLRRWEASTRVPPNWMREKLGTLCQVLDISLLPEGQDL